MLFLSFCTQLLTFFGTRSTHQTKFLNTNASIATVHLWYTACSLFTVTAVLLVYMSLLYQFKVGSHHCVIGDHLKVVHILVIIIGVELLISSSCLFYYIGKCGTNFVTAVYYFSGTKIRYIKQVMNFIVLIYVHIFCKLIIFICTPGSINIWIWSLYGVLYLLIVFTIQFFYVCMRDESDNFYTWDLAIKTTQTEVFALLEKC